MQFAKYILLLLTMWCSVALAQTDTPEERLNKIFKGVNRSEIQLTAKVHEQFWSDFRKFSKSDQAHILDVTSSVIITAHAYQIELWESALKSFKKQKVFKSGEVSVLQKKMRSQMLQSLQSNLTDETRNTFIEAIDTSYQTSISTANLILEAAAKHTILHLPGQDDIEINEALILTISASLKGTFDKIKRLLNPVWTDVISTSIPSVALAGHEKGLAAYNKADYATALRELKPLAIQGNAASQLALGTMYANGQGVPQDYKEAAKWYRLAADQGDKGIAVSDSVNKNAPNTAQYAAQVASRLGMQDEPLVGGRGPTMLEEFRARRGLPEAKTKLTPLALPSPDDLIAQHASQPSLWNAITAGFAGNTDVRLFNAADNLVNHVLRDNPLDAYDPAWRIPQADLDVATEQDMQDLYELKNQYQYDKYKTEKGAEQFRQQTIFSRGTATGVVVLLAAAILDPVNIMLFGLIILFVRNQLRRRRKQQENKLDPN